MELRGYDLRYLLTSLILDRDGAATTAELRLALAELGVTLGADSRRRLYGALRSEARTHRLRPCGDGRYEIDELPRSTRSHIRRRADVVRAAIENGQPHPPPQHRYGAPPPCSPLPSPPLDAWPMVRTLDDLRLPADQPLRDAQRQRNARREEVGHEEG